MYIWANTPIVTAATIHAITINVALLIATKRSRINRVDRG